MVATSASILAESYPTRFFLLASKTFYLENNSNSGTTTASHNDISYDKLNPTGLWAPFSFFFFFLSFCLWKIHHSHPPPRLSSVRLQHWELTRGKRRNIQRQAGAAYLPQGSPFYPLATAEKSKLFGRHTGRLKFGACSGAVPCPTMAGFIRAVSQALATGQRRRAPSGPNQCWGPQERAHQTTL